MYFKSVVLAKKGGNSFKIIRLKQSFVFFKYLKLEKTRKKINKEICFFRNNIL